MVIILNISNVDACDLYAACLCAAKTHADDAKTAENERDETYHRRLSNRYAEVGSIVKKRTDAQLNPPEKAADADLALVNGEKPEAPEGEEKK